MILMGINEGFNASVVVLKDGEIIFALQEERLNKIKEYSGFPEQALKFTLGYLSLKPSDIDAVCLSNLKSPTRTRDELIIGADVRADAPLNPSLLTRIQRKLKQPGKPQEPLRKAPEVYLQEAGFGGVEIKRYHHHLLHAASAYYGVRKNAQEPHLVLTLDGGGDGDCAHIYTARGNDFTHIATSKSGNSIGNIYSAMTHFMGMKPHEHEYKLMGLAAYAKPEYCAQVMEKLRGYLGLDPQNQLVFKHKTREKTSFLYNRLPKDFKRIRFDNLAGGTQFFTEELVCKWVKAAVAVTGIKNVVVAGGVFMNVKANKIISEDPDIAFFDVMPSCGDETLPFGAVWYEYALREPKAAQNIRLKTFCLGPHAGFDLEQAKQKYEGKELKFEKLAAPEDQIAQMMHEGKVVARCSGPMEFGARALGNRSLMADPSRQEIIPFINKIVKKRDFWMPFAPAVLLEDAAQYINIPKSMPPRISPFMMHSFDTTEKRTDFIAGVHAYDLTARAQTIDKEGSPGFWAVLKKFKSLSGKGVSLNTSFNLHGLPIVMGAMDAIHVLLNSGLEYLVVEDTLITKI